MRQSRKELVLLVNGITSIQLFSMVLLPFFVKKMRKNAVMVIGFILAAFGQVVILAGDTNLNLIIAGWILGALSITPID